MTNRLAMVSNPAALTTTYPTIASAMSSTVNTNARTDFTSTTRPTIRALTYPTNALPVLPTVDTRAQVGLAARSPKTTSAPTRKRPRPAALGRQLGARPAVLAEPVAQLARVHRAGLGRPVGSDSC